MIDLSKLKWFSFPVVNNQGFSSIYFVFLDLIFRSLTGEFQVQLDFTRRHYLMQFLTVIFRIGQKFYYYFYLVFFQ